MHKKNTATFASDDNELRSTYYSTYVREEKLKTTSIDGAANHNDLLKIDVRIIL